MVFQENRDSDRDENKWLLYDEDTVPDVTAYSADSAMQFRRKPPLCSGSKRQGIPVDSATPCRSIATLAFSSFS